MRRVLLVDDNRDAADSLALILRQLGHNVFVAHDGASALDVARTARPDVAVLDLVLPSLDGYSLGRALRREFGDGLRMLAMSGFSGEDDRRKAMESGFDQYLVKPLDPGFFFSLLR